MDKYTQRAYYEIKEKLKADPAYLDKITEEFLDQSITPVFWDDHIAEFGNVKVEILRGKDKNGNEIVQHDRYDGNIFQAGTPVDAYNLGQMEWNDLVNYMGLKYLLDTVRRLSIELATLKGGLSNNMPHNSFVADLKAFDGDFVFKEGYYDAVNGRGVV